MPRRGSKQASAGYTGQYSQKLDGQSQFDGTIAQYHQDSTHTTAPQQTWDTSENVTEPLGWPEQQSFSHTQAEVWSHHPISSHAASDRDFKRSWTSESFPSSTGIPPSLYDSNTSAPSSLRSCYGSQCGQPALEYRTLDAGLQELYPRTDYYEEPADFDQLARNLPGLPRHEIQDQVPQQGLNSLSPKVNSHTSLWKKKSLPKKVAKSSKNSSSKNGPKYAEGEWVTRLDENPEHGRYKVCCAHEVIKEEGDDGGEDKDTDEDEEHDGGHGESNQAKSGKGKEKKGRKDKKGSKEEKEEGQKEHAKQTKWIYGLKDTESNQVESQPGRKMWFEEWELLLYD